jgi:glycosyltransferase involved in cell wall biosynthesis
MAASNPALFVSWWEFHGRSHGLAEQVGAEDVYVWRPGGNLVLRYLRQWRDTARLLRERRPAVVLVMQPPPVALLPVLAYARRSGAKIAGDLHTGAFNDPKWAWSTRWVLSRLRRHGLVIVTNEALKRIAEQQGCQAVAVHDSLDETRLPADVEVFDDAGLATLPEGGYAVFPLAYAGDEPIAQIFAAAALLPQVPFALTGRAPQALQAQAPANVRFTGYVTNDDLARLIGRAGCVVGLTTREYTMQRSGYEALSLGVPLVVSGTRVLREYFADAAIFVENEAAAVAAAIEEALSRRAELAERMVRLRAVRAEEQRQAVLEIKRWIESVTA